MIRSLSFLLTALVLVLATLAHAAPQKEYQTLYKKGVEQNRKGNFKEAITLYSRAIEKKPDSPELFFVRGRAYRQNEQYDEALRDLDRAIALKPNYAEAYSQRGVLQIGRGDTAKARSDFKKSCDLGNQDGCANLKKLDGMKRMP